MPPHQFEELMGKLGVSNDTLVVLTTITTTWWRRACGGC